MPDYKHGKIYKVVSDNTNDVYIGSTAYPRLSWRYRQHLYSSRTYPGRCSADTVVLAGGAHIELLEEVPCETRAQLNEREQHWLDQHKARTDVNVVNRRAAFRRGKL